MARKRDGASLIDDTYERADCEGYEDRHPRPKVLRYLNQGKAALRDIILANRGALYFRSPTPWTFTTTRNTILYTANFPPTFLEALSVRVDCRGCNVADLDLAGPRELPLLLDKGACGYPTHYDLRPNGIEIYPRHQAGLTITVEWIPASDDITDDEASFLDGFDGWEDFVVAYAAKRLAEKDGDRETAASCLAEMAEVEARVKLMAPKRDRHRPRRVQDARGARMFGRLRGGGGGV